MTMKEMMSMAEVGQPFTSGNWLVTPGNEEEFVRRWTAFTTWAQKEASGAQGFVLLRHVDDPRHFVSFGSWESEEAVDRWRSSPEFARYLGACRELCEEFRPSDSIAAAVVAP
jgi:heme-degrading monooxygenase HmoA